MATVTQNPSVIIRDEELVVPFIVGDLPGSADPADDDDMFSGGLERRPINPNRALRAMLSSGAVMAVGHAVAEGTTGMGFRAVPVFDENKPKEEWPKGAAEQRSKLNIFLKTGFRGEEIINIRDGLYCVEHDRFSVGWGGCTVFRDIVSSKSSPIPEPVAIGSFESAGAQFTKPDRKPTMVPIPIATDDGVIWTEVPRYFRRILFTGTNGRKTWFKQYGDWRTMDSRTGKYSTGSRYKPPTSPFQPGTYTPGRLPKGGARATEVMTWSTRFPGVGPYGISGWHSEFLAVESAKEHMALLLSYLKSGLHSVVIAAADRQFETATADAAVEKIDKLGRGREGLAALITIALKPSGSNDSRPFADGSTSDRGRLVLHELNTKLPDHLTDATLSDALTTRIAQSERIPELLIGRSGSYNFSTASAAWSTANRLRFSPHHRQKEEFLNRIIIEMGITLWQIETISPEWSEKESIGSVGSVLGQMGGVSINRAIQMLSIALDIDIDKVSEWWGDLPMQLVTKILESEDPESMAKALGVDIVFPKDSNVVASVMSAVDRIESSLSSIRTD